MTVTFTVPGKPRGKARPRFSRGHAYTPKKTAEYEAMIRRLYLMQGGGKFEGAVRLSILALFPIPKRTPKLTARQMLSGDILPTKKPDGDNIEKAVADALNGAAYDDDSQVVSASWEKRFAEEEHCGLIITVADFAEGEQECCQTNVEPRGETLAEVGGKVSEEKEKVTESGYDGLRGG